MAPTVCSGIRYGGALEDEADPETVEAVVLAEEAGG